MTTKKAVLSGLFWKFGERITAQLVSLLVSIILARLLTPDDYGAVALVMVFITIANVFVSSGLGNALIQKKDADNLDFSSVLYINIAVSIFIYLILFASAPLIAKFYDMPVLNPVLRVLGIRIPVAAINSIQHAYVSRNMLFPCVPFLRIFCFTYGLWPIHTANLQAINALGRSDLFLKLEVIKKILGLIVLVMTIPLGPLAIAAGLIVTGILSTFINSFPNRKLLDYKYIEQLKDIFPSFGLALFMGVCAYCISFFKMPDLIIVIVQIVVGAALYIGSSKILKLKVLEYLYEMVKLIFAGRLGGKK